MKTTQELIDKVLKLDAKMRDAAEKGIHRIFDDDHNLAVAAPILAKMLQRAIEQRDTYFEGQHHALGYSLEKDNAELDRLASEARGEK